MQNLIIITGASGGIGRALSQHLAERGLDVLAIGRRLDALEETASANPERITPLSADVASSEGRQKIVDSIPANAKIVALVHNAGVLQPLALLEEISVDQWRNIAAVNIEAPLFLTQALLDRLSDARVLHLSSGLAHWPMAGVGAYCMTKAALYMLYQCYNQEFAERDTVVGSVMPGIVGTEMNVKLRGNALTQQIGAQPVVAPETVAAFLSWLVVDVDKQQFAAQEWDIYDTAHHQHWIADHPVPALNT